MKYQLNDGLNLYYEIHGQSDSKKTIVFINGLSQSTLSWAGFLPLLSTDYQILLVDLVFQGQSDKEGEFRSFEQHAQDVASLLKGLNIPKAYIAGISYGGAVTMRLLVNHPEIVEKGILLSTFARKTAYFEALGLSWGRALIAGGYDLMLDVMLPGALGKSYFENPIIPVEILKTARKELHPSKDALLKLMKATETSGNYLQELSKVKTPVLILAGEEDILCTPDMHKEIQAAIEGSKLEIFKKVGHTLNLEAISMSANAIKEFIEKT